MSGLRIRRQTGFWPIDTDLRLPPDDPTRK
jgi:hypothetical protein